MRRQLLTAAAVCLLVLAMLPAGIAAQEATATPTATPEPTATPTATPTGTPENTTDDEPAGPAIGTQPISVYVEQPRWVSDAVSESTSDGLRLYSVQGNVHELAPEGINASNVVRSGVREDNADWRFDSGIGRWVLDAQGTAGTYNVYWVVLEDGSTTTYGAVISVEQAEYQHVSPGRFDDLENGSENWQWVRDRFEGAGLLASDAGVDQARGVIGDAVTWYKFYVNPLSALTGQFFTFALFLVRWPAGWIILGSIFLAFFLYHRKTERENRRFKRQFARIEDVDEAERRAEERELKRMLSMQTFTDLGLSASDAEAIKQHCDADNPRQFLERLRDGLSEQHIVRLLLGAHEQRGDHVRIRRDADGIADMTVLKEPYDGESIASTDGGTVLDDADEEVPEVEYVKPTDLDESQLLQLDWTELNPDILWDEEVAATDLGLPVANDAQAEDDLVAEWDIPIGEDGHDYYILERREEFAELLLTFIQNVAASQYTDDDGKIRPEVDLIEFMYTFTSVGAEKYRWSLHDTVDVLLYNRQRLDADDRMDDLADRSRQGDA
jgi:hypothetical protein